MIDPARIWSSRQLPTLPGVAVRLLRLCGDPDAHMAEVIRTIQNDPAIAAKVLRAANSSLFGLRLPVTSIHRAVTVVGTTGVTSLALSFGLEDSAVRSGPLAEHYRSYWLQSVVQAAAAELLADRSQRSLRGEYFMAGLLVDIGRLALLKTVPQDYLPVLSQAEESHAPLVDVERELLGIDHAQVGAGLMEKWRLPEGLRRACELHHAAAAEIVERASRGRDNGREREERNDSQLVRVAALAAAAGEYFCAKNKVLARKELEDAAGALFGLSDAELEALLGQVKGRIDECADLFSVAAEDLPSPAELTSAANEQLAELVMREYVGRSVATARQMEAERQRQESEARSRELQTRALRDSLTDIYNRRFFDAALQREVGRAMRQGKPLGVIFADLDGFKQLNDGYGHPFGDLVLQRAARGLAGELRQSDVVARYGGDEFVVLVADATCEQMHTIAERLRARLEAERFYRGGQRVAVTISVGAAIGTPKDTGEEWKGRLIAAADEAMYISKHEGRNRVTFCQVGDNDESNRLIAAEQTAAAVAAARG